MGVREGRAPRLVCHGTPKIVIGWRYRFN